MIYLRLAGLKTKMPAKLHEFDSIGKARSFVKEHLGENPSKMPDMILAQDGTYATVVSGTTLDELMKTEVTSVLNTERPGASSPMSFEIEWGPSRDQMDTLPETE